MLIENPKHETFKFIAPKKLFAFISSAGPQWNNRGTTFESTSLGGNVRLKKETFNDLEKNLLPF